MVPVSGQGHGTPTLRPGSVPAYYPSASEEIRGMYDRIGSMAESVKRSLDQNFYSPRQVGPDTRLPTFRGRYHESFERFQQKLILAFKHLNWDESCSSRWSCLPSVLEGDAETTFYTFPDSVRENFHLVMEALRSEYGRHTKDMMQIHDIIESCILEGDKLDEYNEIKSRLFLEADLPETDRVRLYIKGLTLDMRCQLGMSRPTTLKEAKALARKALTTVKLMQSLSTDRIAEIAKSTFKELQDSQMAAVSDMPPYPHSPRNDRSYRGEQEYGSDRSRRRERYHFSSRDYDRRYSRDRSRDRDNSPRSHSRGRYYSHHSPRTYLRERHYSRRREQQYISQHRSPRHDSTDRRYTTRSKYESHPRSSNKIPDSHNRHPSPSHPFCTECNNYHPSGSHSLPSCTRCEGIGHLIYECRAPSDGTTDQQLSSLATIDTSSTIHSTHFFADSAIQLQVKGHKYPALIDSGSAISAIRLNTFRGLFPKATYTIKPTNQKFNTVSGNSMAPEGTALISFNIGSVKCDLNFFIFQDMTNQIILGRDFMDKYECAIDFKNKRILFNSAARIQSSKSYVLQPGEVCLIQAKLTGDMEFPTGLNGIVQSANKRAGYSIIETAGTVFGNSVPVMIQNNNFMPLKIRKNQKLSQFCPADESSCRKVPIAQDTPDCDKSAASPPSNLDMMTIEQSDIASVNEPLTHKSQQIAEAFPPPPEHMEAPVTASPDCYQPQHTRDTASTQHSAVSNSTDNAKDRDFTDRRRPKTPVHLQKELPIDLSTCDISDDQVKVLKNVIYSHYDAFITSETDLGYCDLVTAKIQLKPDYCAMKLRPYRLNPIVEQILQKQVDLMLKQGILEHSSDSNFASPVLAVRKNERKSRRHLQNKSHSEAKWRCVLDFRHLNSQCLDIKIQIPSLISMLDVIAVNQPKIMSVFDISNAFFQIPLHKDSRHLTQFFLGPNAYRFKRLPQGLKLSPFIMTQTINLALQKLINKTCVCFIDDILCFSKSFDEHIQHLNELLGTLEQHGFKLAPGKSFFCRKSVTYLGYDINQHGVTPSLSHVEAIRTFPTPTNVKSLRTFIGAASYFSRHFADKGRYFGPLLALTKKHATFHWTDEHQMCFDTIKRVMSSKPLLIHPNFNKRFYLFCDASDISIGSCLAQLDESTNTFRPVAYHGRSL